METRKYSISIGAPFTVPNIEQAGHTANWQEISTSDCASVSSATQLANITGTYAYKLSSDISLSGNWTPISGFSGYLDGNGYTISGNITITPDANNNAGLFGLISNAYIVNLKLKLTVTVSNTGSSVSAGILAGTMSEDSVVLSNSVEDSSLSVYSSVACAGFVAGTASNVLFSQCEATNSAIAASSSSTKKGALAGAGNNTTIYDCSYSTCSGVSADFGESVSGTTWAVNLWNEENGDSENSVNFCNTIGIQESEINSDVVTSQNQALLRPDYWGFGTHNAGEIFTPSTNAVFDFPAYIIFPHYTANTYTIKYNGNGATGGSMSDSSLLFGQGNKISAVGFIREDATFLGWSLESTVTSATYANACSIDIIAVGANNNNATINLYAVWELTAVNITFDNAGATTAGTESVSLDIGGALPNITVPARAKYKFNGYYTAENGGGTKIYNANGTPAVTASTFTSNTTLYAYWTLNTYNVIFDDSGFANKVGALVGGFENTGWSGGEYDTTHVRSGQYSYKIVAPASLREKTVCTTQTVALNSTTKSHKFYAQYWGYQEAKSGNQTTQIYWPVEEPSFGQPALGAVGQWNMYSFYGDRSNNGLSGEMVVRLDFDNRETAGTIWFDDFLLIDLTEIFGAGNEPNKAWCDANIRAGLSTQEITRDVATSLTNHSTTNSLTGMTFAGWSTSPRTGTTAQTVTYTNGQSVTNLATAGGTKILYAVWKPLNYNITINANDETAVGILLGAGPQPYGTTVTLAAYAKKGYNFSHWLRNGQEFDGNDQNTLAITIGTTNPTYTAVFEESGVKLETFSVSATTGGVAYVVGNEASNLADNETVTVATKPCLLNYEFVGWYLDNDRTTCLSTATSYRVTKSVAYKHILVAVYQPVSNNNVNLEVDNG